jgi:hypothetical protein
VGPNTDPEPEDEPLRSGSQEPAIRGREPWRELAEVDAPSADLPAFLTAEEPVPAELDAALAD